MRADSLKGPMHLSVRAVNTAQAEQGYRSNAEMHTRHLSGGSRHSPEIEESNMARSKVTNGEFQEKNQRETKDRDPEI